MVPKNTNTSNELAVSSLQENCPFLHENALAVEMKMQTTPTTMIFIFMSLERLVSFLKPPMKLVTNSDLTLYLRMQFYSIMIPLWP